MHEQVVLIFGATSMIGSALAELYTKQSSHLLLIGRDRSKLEQLCASLPREVDFVATDLSIKKNIDYVVNEALAKFGRIDVAHINLATYPYERIDQLSVDAWQQSISIGLTAPFLILQALFPTMRKAKGGRVVIFSSIAGEKMGRISMSAYTACKAGLNGLMRTAALEGAADQILVNCISPGRMYDRRTMSDEEFHEKVSPIPLKEFIPPEEIAHLAYFLTSEKAKHITGQNFVVDGGQTIG